jgi:hypothetical protein
VTIRQCDDPLAVSDVETVRHHDEAAVRLARQRGKGCF